MGRANGNAELIKAWGRDFVFEESLELLFKEENFPKGELLNNVAMFAYQTVKLIDVDKKKMFETLNALYSKGLKGQELLEQFQKETSINLTAPVDFKQAASKAIRLINSEF